MFVKIKATTKAVMKRSEALTPATTWMSLKHMVLSERSQAQRPHCVQFHVCERSRAGTSRDRKWVSGCQGLGQGMGVPANGDGVSFSGDEDVFEQDRSNGAHHCECSKCHGI